MSPRDAIFEACMLRFRPILMTTMAATFGALPLAFGTGTGSELRRPLGITIVGGLLLSQLLTLYTTPVVYLAMDRLRIRATGKDRDELPSLPEEATARSSCEDAGARGDTRMKRMIFEKTMRNRFVLPAGALALMALIHGGCQRPDRSTTRAPTAPAVTAPNYKESTVNFKDAAGWKVANPSDAMLRGNWWELFNEPELNALEEQLNVKNQNIKQSFSRNYMEARSTIDEARAQILAHYHYGALLVQGSREFRQSRSSPPRPAQEKPPPCGRSQSLSPGLPTSGARSAMRSMRPNMPPK